MDWKEETNIESRKIEIEIYATTHNLLSFVCPSFLKAVHGLWSKGKFLAT